MRNKNNLGILLKGCPQGQTGGKSLVSRPRMDDEFCAASPSEYLLRGTQMCLECHGSAPMSDGLEAAAWEHSCELVPC